MSVKIAPSILSANFIYLDKEIKAIEKAGADIIHLDVMDGHFVPNLTFGPGIISQIRKQTKLPLDAHLMISNPDDLIDKFIKTGVNYISFHIELSVAYKDLLKEIRNSNIKAGIAINPETPLVKVKNLLDYMDYILIMSVHPGWGGQEYIKSITSKISSFTKMKNARGIDIEVDGGINQSTAKFVKKAGANILVAGHYIFNSKNYKKRIDNLRYV